MMEAFKKNMSVLGTLLALAALTIFVGFMARVLLWCWKFGWGIIP